MVNTVHSTGGEEKFYFTVGQLAEVLKTLPQDLPVLVNGIESGYENFHHPHVVKLKHEPDIYYKDGEFQYCDKGEDGVQAVVLSRVNRDD